VTAPIRSKTCGRRLARFVQRTERESCFRNGGRTLANVVKRLIFTQLIPLLRSLKLEQHLHPTAYTYTTALSSYYGAELIRSLRKRTTRCCIEHRRVAESACSVLACRLWPGASAGNAGRRYCSRRILRGNLLRVRFFETSCHRRDARGWLKLGVRRTLTSLPFGAVCLSLRLTLEPAR